MGKYNSFLIMKSYDNISTSKLNNLKEVTFILIWSIWVYDMVGPCIPSEPNISYIQFSSSKK